MVSEMLIVFSPLAAWITYAAYKRYARSKVLHSLDAEGLRNTVREYAPVRDKQEAQIITDCVKRILRSCQRAAQAGQLKYTYYHYLGPTLVCWVMLALELRGLHVTNTPDVDTGGCDQMHISWERKDD